MTGEPDKRVARTRGAILHAFARLVFERRYEAIRVGEIVAAAGVGRATFYEHFRGKDEVLLAAMEPILLPLAGAATGRASKVQVRTMLEHVWQNRAMGRVVLGSAGAKLERRLAAMIDACLPEPSPMRAAGAAAAQLAMLRMWIAGEASCTAGALGQRMLDCAAIARGGGQSRFANSPP